VDENNMPHMVDVGNKNVTRRVARARALVDLPNVIVEQFDKQKKEIQSKVTFSKELFCCGDLIGRV
jgi:molybdenum cofactor biosynthesis enzyme